MSVTSIRQRGTMYDEIYRIIWFILECNAINLFHVIYHEFGHAMMAYLLFGMTSTLSLDWVYGWCVGASVKFIPYERRKTGVSRLRRHYGRYGKYIYRAMQISISLAGPVMGSLFLIGWYHGGTSYSSDAISQGRWCLVLLLLLNQLYNLFPLRHHGFTSDGYYIAREFQICEKTLMRCGKICGRIHMILDGIVICWFIVLLVTGGRV